MEAKMEAHGPVHRATRRTFADAWIFHMAVRRGDVRHEHHRATLDVTASQAGG